MKEIEVIIERSKETGEGEKNDTNSNKKRIDIHLDVIESRGVGFDGCGNHTHK